MIMMCCAAELDGVVRDALLLDGCLWLDRPRRPGPRPRPRRLNANAWADAVKDGHAQLYQGEMKPVDEAQLNVWKEAITIPAAPR